MKQLGGFIYPVSKMGRGTTFKIFLPAWTGAVEETGADAIPEGVPMATQPMRECPRWTMHCSMPHRESNRFATAVAALWPPHGFALRCFGFLPTRRHHAMPSAMLGACAVVPSASAAIGRCLCLTCLGVRCNSGKNLGKVRLV
jgi:hypothetical protein